MLTVFVIIFWLRCNSSFWWKKITLFASKSERWTNLSICIFKNFFYSNEQRDWLYLMSFISCVPCWLAVIGIQAQLLFKKSCLWEKKQASGCQWGFLWTYCHSLDNFFTVRVTESGPKSGKNSIVLLETEKVILLDCRLKVYEMRQKMSFRVNVSTIAKSTQLCRKRTVFFAFLGTSWCRLDCD